MQPGSNLYRFGPFRLDVTERVLLREGQLIPLPPKAFLALLVLVRNSGHVVDKDVLLDELWPDQDVEENNVAQNIFIVRRALGEVPGSPKYIETVPRRGYRFIAAVTGISSVSNAVKEAYQPTKRYTENPEAYQAYLRGRYSWSKHTREGLEEAIEHFQHAIDLDPAYALANAAVVDCHLRLATNYLPPPEALPRIASAIKSGEMDDSSPEVKALIKMRCKLDQIIAEQDIKRAIDLNSTYPPAYQWHSARQFIVNRLKLSGAYAIRDESPARIDSSFEHQLESISPTRDEQVQILCTIARQQFDVGNYEAGCVTLEDWWTIGEWPRLDGLGQYTSAELLFVTGALARRMASAKPVQRGPKNGEELLNGSIALFEQLGLRSRAAHGRMYLAFCYRDEGEYDLARPALLTALESLSDEDDLEARCKALIMLADLDVHVWRLQESLARLREASAILKHTSILASCRYHQAAALAFEYQAVNENRLTDFELAIQHHRAALHEMEALGDHRFSGKIENNFGCLLLKLKRFDEAEFYLSRARKRLHALGDTYGCGQVDDSLAQLHLSAGRLEVALQAAESAVDTFESSSHQAYLAEHLLTQGIALCRLGRLNEAKRTLHQACYFAERSGDFDHAGDALLTVIEEMFAKLEETERLELARELDHLLADSQQVAMRERLGKCLQLIAGASVNKEQEHAERPDLLEI
jgi:DNA-binding winged helix-turn-helix (wHTH) protein